MRNGTCRGCGAPIIWIGTPKGKSMPCDAEAVYYKANANGKSKIVTPNGIVVTCDIITVPEKADGIGYIPHWSTCPKADTFRKSKQS